MYADTLSATVALRIAVSEVHVHASRPAVLLTVTVRSLRTGLLFLVFRCLNLAQLVICLVCSHASTPFPRPHRPRLSSPPPDHAAGLCS